MSRISVHTLTSQDYAPGELLATLSNASQAPVKAYSSVQYGPGPDHHLELNSDLLFSALGFAVPPPERFLLTALVNHSCAPTAQLQLPAGTPARWEVHVGPAGLAKGEDITFFYPSTEWDMAQGFDCNCGAKVSSESDEGGLGLTFSTDLPRQRARRQVLDARAARGARSGERPHPGTEGSAVRD